MSARAASRRRGGARAVLTQALADLAVVTALVRVGGEASTVLSALYVLVIATYALLRPAIPAVKAQIRGLRLDECQRLAERALAAESAQEVRALVPDQHAQPTSGNVRS